MAKITIDHDTPSQTILKAASQPSNVTDTRGRQITIKKLNALDRMKMLEVVGAENSKNEVYLGYASLAFHVTAIDGDLVLRPSSKAHLEALVSRLDDDGLNAVGEALVAAQEAAENGEDQLKNASGTRS